MLRQKSHEFRQFGHFFDGNDVTQVARQNRGEVGAQPILTPPFGLTADRLRKPTLQDELDQIITDDCIPLAVKRSVEQAFQKGGRPAFYLGSGLASGSIWMVSICPAKLSAICGKVSTCAEPVSRKRPGR